MSSSVMIYRYLNEDKHNIYNQTRNITDKYKYNNNEEFKKKQNLKNMVYYYRKKQEFIDETINEFIKFDKDEQKYITHLKNTQDKHIRKKKKIISKFPLNPV